MKTIMPLGMEYKRASALKKIAKIVIDSYGGKIPTTSKELMDLPCVGRYTSNALMCLAYGKDYPLLDTNAVRVITRVFSIKSSKIRPRDDSQMWNFVSSLIPSKKAREFNLAVLDIAYSICHANNPGCQVCPLLCICDHGSLGIRGSKTNPSMTY
jgi:A/G-specific adenine glycosylase